MSIILLLLLDILLTGILLLSNNSDEPSSQDHLFSRYIIFGKWVIWRVFQTLYYLIEYWETRFHFVHNRQRGIHCCSAIDLHWEWASKMKGCSSRMGHNGWCSVKGAYERVEDKLSVLVDNQSERWLELIWSFPLSSPIILQHRRRFPLFQGIYLLVICIQKQRSCFGRVKNLVFNGTTEDSCVCYMSLTIQYLGSDLVLLILRVTKSWCCLVDPRTQTRS